MKLEKIITLANKSVYLRFIAMERSLRATGCTLPLLVIPYDSHLFELPSNAKWFEHPELFSWLDENRLRGVYRKYLCLLQENFLFVDSDVIFLKNPEKPLSEVDGFISSCGHWHNPTHTITDVSEKILKEITTNWQGRVFNTGQFASAITLFQWTSLRAMAEDERYRMVCMHQNMHEQPGINLLVNLSGVYINNLTLPPYNMESTWAGDYTSDDYEKYWIDEKKKPFIIHWAGRSSQMLYPIDKLFFRFLNEEEQKQWKPVPPKRNGILQRLKRNLISFFKNFVLVS
jgi:hypothetical protein